MVGHDYSICLFTALHEASYVTCIELLIKYYVTLIQPNRVLQAHFSLVNS